MVYSEFVTGLVLDIDNMVECDEKLTEFRPRLKQVIIDANMCQFLVLFVYLFSFVYLRFLVLDFEFHTLREFIHWINIPWIKIRAEVTILEELTSGIWFETLDFQLFV